MQFDFDRIIDRRGTCCSKHDQWQECGKQPDALPLWVADMDFAVAPCITQALSRRVEHGVYGYSFAGQSYYDALSAWFEGRFGWPIEKDWVVKTTGVVFALQTAILGLTEPGDAVLIQQPVYSPFKSVIEKTGRTLVVNDLCYRDGRYSIDFADFEKKIREHQVKLFLLCSPHNPVGRVWREEELLRMGEICKEYGVLVASDEIHCDFVYPGHRHRVFAALRKDFADFTVTCTAPSKTFNLAGLDISNIVISNESLRSKFQGALSACGAPGPGIMGLTACEAAYTGGGPWLEELLEYLEGTVNMIRTFLAERIPGVRMVEPEGTYLVWLDFSGLGLKGEALRDFVSNKARLWLNEGSGFGQGGDCFQRMNITSPRSVILQALERLEAAVASLAAAN